MGNRVKINKGFWGLEKRVKRYLALKESGVPDANARELSRYENDPYPEKCSQCGAGPEDFVEGKGMVGEDVIWCGRCNTLLWENTVDAVRRVL